MFNCYTTTGSFSRSAVNQSVGAKTQIAGLITGFFMLFVLLVLTPLLATLPANVQGAVVIAGVLPLLDWREWLFLLSSNLLDFTVWNVACLGTMIWGVETGIAVSVGLSLALIVFQVSFPHVVTLGRIENSRVYRSTELYVNAVPEPGIMVVRVDAPIIFANFPNIRQFIRTAIILNKDKIDDANNQGVAPPARIHSVIVDLSAVPYIDTSAIHLLHDFVDELKAGGRRGGGAIAICQSSRGSHSTTVIGQILHETRYGRLLLRHTRGCGMGQGQPAPGARNSDSRKSCLPRFGYDVGSPTSNAGAYSIVQCNSP